ncbi:alpha/beta fold hydrolase [Ectothiorhodospiraceae bacterium 2226]|nr:alpha/beta fold hydrolase [Ectothiorhodospiraceae bacterium 2226]
MFLLPDRVERLSPDRLELQYEDVWLHAADGTRVHAWHLKAEGPREGTILFFHGNAQNNSAHIASVHWLPAQGFDVFMLDPRGYGQSDGEPHIRGVHLDAQAALDHVADAACGEIIVYGQSLGGAIGIHTVARSPHAHCVRAVVSEGAFASYRGIAREKLGMIWLTWPLQVPLSYLFSDRYSPARVVDQISPVPLLIVHGTDDHIVPAHHAERLYRAAEDPRDLWLLPDVGHIGSSLHEENRARLVGWLVAALNGDRSLAAEKPAPADAAN